MYRNAPARSQNVKCRFIVTFVCTEEFLLGFFLSSRIITLSKILPLGPNFNLTCILYYILWRIHISDLSLNVCNCCRVKERKVNDDKRLEGQNGVTLYALGHFMAWHKKIWMECTYHNIQYQTVILMIWSENKVIYSRCRFKKLNRREFQYSDLFISNEFRAELILKTVPVHENILWLKSWDCIISRWHVIIMQHLIYKYMFKTYFQGKSLLRK